MDNLKLMLEKILDFDVHLLHLFLIATRTVERCWDGDNPLFISSQICKKSSQAMPSGQGRHSADVRVRARDELARACG